MMMPCGQPRKGEKYPSPIKGMGKGRTEGGIKVWITFKDKTYVGQTLNKQTKSSKQFFSSPNATFERGRFYIRYIC